MTQEQGVSSLWQLLQASGCTQERSWAEFSVRVVPQAPCPPGPGRGALAKGQHGQGAQVPAAPGLWAPSQQRAASTEACGHLPR